MRGPPRARVAIVFALLMPLVAFAQDVTEPVLKAAFIYNFIRFTEWPETFPASDLGGRVKTGHFVDGQNRPFPGRCGRDQ